jgi:hypothetical protein
VASGFVDTGRGYIHDCKDQFGMLKHQQKLTACAGLNSAVGFSSGDC